MSALDIVDSIFEEANVCDNNMESDKARLIYIKGCMILNIILGNYNDKETKNQIQQKYVHYILRAKELQYFNVVNKDTQ